MKLFVATLILVGLCVVGMGVNLFFRKDGRFPQYDVGSNEEMQKRGIRCFKDEDAALHARGCKGSYGDACRDCNLYKQ